MINVLVVEDARVVRDYLVHLLETCPDIRVIGTADSGEAALAFVDQRQPDAILMDIHLPGLDGFETTREIMATHPVPIVVCTASVHFSQVNTAMRAMEAGALAVVRKPQGIGHGDADADCATIVDTIKLMSEVKVVRRWRPNPPAGLRDSDVRPALCGRHGKGAAIVAIGASTGGPPALLQILSGLTRAFPAPILIVQHIATGFTAGFAQWLGTASGWQVQVVEGGDTPLPGRVYVAPDGRHLQLGVRGELLTTSDAPRQGVCPSVDVLFRSVAQCHGSRAIGVLLTGMGRDGADALKHMADRGALTIAQDEASSTVFGMPGAAIALGGAQYVLPPHKIAALLQTAIRHGAISGGFDG